jgi:hypothetical protein
MLTQKSWAELGGDVSTGEFGSLLRSSLANPDSDFQFIQIDGVLAAQEYAFTSAAHRRIGRFPPIISLSFRSTAAASGSIGRRTTSCGSKGRPGAFHPLSRSEVLKVTRTSVRSDWGLRMPTYCRHMPRRVFVFGIARTAVKR